MLYKISSQHVNYSYKKSIVSVNERMMNDAIKISLNDCVKSSSGRVKCLRRRKIVLFRQSYNQDVEKLNLAIDRDNDANRRRITLGPLVCFFSFSLHSHQSSTSLMKNLSRRKTDKNERRGTEGGGGKEHEERGSVRQAAYHGSEIPF